MAHDIATVNGQNAFAYSGLRPWHNLGIKIPSLMTVEEALIFARMDWSVGESPLQMTNVDMTPVATHKATYRTEKNDKGEEKRVLLGVVGSAYQVVQNQEAFDFFNHAIEKGAACIETMGALGNGERVFAMAKLPDDFEVTKNDPIERYILLCTSHDGSMNIQAMFSNIRVVCQNTMNAAIRGARQIVRIRHTKNAKSKLEQAHKVLAASDKYWSRLRAAYSVLALKDMSRLDTLTLLEELFPGKVKKAAKEAEESDDIFADVEEEEGAESPIVSATRTVNNRMKVLALFDGQAIGADKAGKTAWGLYNAVTQYIDRDRSVRKDTNRWEASVFGSGTALRQKAFDSLIRVAAQ